MKLRFTLRELILAMLVIALAIGWFSEFWRSRLLRPKAANWDGYIRSVDGKKSQPRTIGHGPGKKPADKPSSFGSTLDVLSGEPMIIHVRDWHLVPREDFVADTGLSGDELDAAYEDHLQIVKAVQRSQREILAICDLVYCEGLSEDDYVIFKAMIRVQQREPDELTLLHLGAAAQLMVDGKLKALPCEGEAEHIAANPLKSGQFDFDDAANETREDAIVRNVTKSGRTAYVVLGGTHDLADNIGRVAEGWGYRVITPAGYPE